MTRQVLYVAAPLRPTEEEIEAAKLGAEPPPYERDPVTTMDFAWWVQVGMQQHEAAR